MKQDEKGIEDAKRAFNACGREIPDLTGASHQLGYNVAFKIFQLGYDAGRSDSGQAAGENGLRGVWFLQGEDFHYPAIPRMYPVTIQDAFGARLVVDRLFVEGDGWDVEDGWEVIAYAEIEPYTPPQPSSEDTI